MNKKNNRKGFTIVELVIVIAVIAILAAVLIPTFGNIIEKAQTSAAIQEARTIYTNYVANVEYADGETALETVLVKTEDGKYVQVTDSELATELADAPAADGACTPYIDYDSTVKYVGSTHNPATGVCGVCGQTH